MSELKIVATEQSVTVARGYAVFGAEPMAKRYTRTVTYSPTDVTLTWRDGRFVNAALAGDRLSKNGGPTGTRATDTLWDAAAWPDWLRDLIERETAGVRAQYGWR